jgi:prolipoprotein diacylglyceryltransferase
MANFKGLLFSIFLVDLFSARFIIEFFKENQVAFEEGMKLNMGQWLSIPFVLFGLILFFKVVFTENFKDLFPGNNN